jgi:hypothetical protein
MKSFGPQNPLKKEHKMDDLTTEQIAQHYTAMGHSVALINDIISGGAMADDTTEDKQDCVDRNVGHLEIMVAKDFWTDEDMTAANAAISAGNAYTA